LKPYKIYNFIRFSLLPKKPHSIGQYNLSKVRNYKIYLSFPKGNKISQNLNLKCNFFEKERKKVVIFGSEEVKC
jgi:hypothetical protein